MKLSEFFGSHIREAIAVLKGEFDEQRLEVSEAQARAGVVMSMQQVKDELRSAEQPGGHCWHGEQNLWNTAQYPPTFPMICCHCGLRGVRRQISEQLEGHGEYYKPVSLGAVEPSGPSLCVAVKNSPSR